MTAVLPRASTPSRADESRDASRSVVAHRIALWLLLAGTGVLYLWNLPASGWGNAFTVDKAPAALWVVDVSVRVFGLNSWSVLAPQAVAGIAAVAVLYAAVRQAAGPGGWPGGLLASPTPGAGLTALLAADADADSIAGPRPSSGRTTRQVINWPGAHP